MITRAIEGYKYTLERLAGAATENGPAPEDRTPLGERNPRALNDDYVKFIRFAQLKMDAVEEGVVGNKQPRLARQSDPSGHAPVADA